MNANKTLNANSGAKVLRAPVPDEGIVVSGWGLAEGIRALLAVRPDLDGLEIEMILARLELSGMHGLSTGPTGIVMANALEHGGNPLPPGLEWCLDDTYVFVCLPQPPADCGLTNYMERHARRNVYIGVRRRYITMHEDPHDAWPGQDDDFWAKVARDSVDVKPVDIETMQQAWEGLPQQWLIDSVEHADADADAESSSKPDIPYYIIRVFDIIPMIHEYIPASLKPAARWLGIGLYSVVGLAVLARERMLDR